MSALAIAEMALRAREFRAANAPRFERVYCAQCGGEFGPRDSGYSHCSDHIRDAREQVRRLLERQP